MIPDFSAIDAGQHMNAWAQAQGVATTAHLRALTVALYDEVAAILGDADDAAVTFIPNDPDAFDEHAPEAEQRQGWNLAHLVLHTTASAEEWAATASILARGIAYPREPRLRIEPDWHTFTTRAQVDQRLAESRRMVLAFLDTFPDAPDFAVERDISERFIEKFGPINALTGFLFGLRHQANHLEQMREATRQARAASTP